MPRSLIDDAFDHHGWATACLLDACLGLTPAQLAATVPGAYGSILATLRHFVGGDHYFLAMLNEEPEPRLDTTSMGVKELRATADANAAGWRALLGRQLDPDTAIRDVDDEGWTRDAPPGIRLAQALDHASEHRGQVCTVLTALGLEPPDLSAWRFGAESGRMTDVPPASAGS